MWQYYCELFSAAWRNALAAGSSTGYSMLVLGIGAVLVTSGITLLVEWARGGYTVSAFRAVWKQWPTYVLPPLVIMLLWALTFGVMLIRAPFDERKASVKEVMALRADRDSWKGKYESMRSPDSPNAPPRLPIGTANARVTFVQKPLAVNSDPNASKWAPGSDKQGVEAVVTVETSFKHPAFLVKCSVPCIYSRGYSMSSAYGDEPLPMQKDASLAGVRVRVPGVMEAGQQVILEFRSRDDRKLSLRWVRPYVGKSS